MKHCPYCGKPFDGENVYCGEACSSIAMVEGWTSDGKTPQEYLIAKGAEAPIDEVVKCFDEHGGLGSFARKEMPAVCRTLGINTVGDLAKYTRSEIVGPQCRYAGNKTLSWVDMVLEQFGLELQKKSKVPLPF